MRRRGSRQSPGVVFAVSRFVDVADARDPAGASERSLIAAVRGSLRLIGGRARSRYFLVVVAQMTTSLLDLVGVALVGLTVVLAYSSSTGAPPPSIVQDLQGRLGLSNVPATSIAVMCGIAAALALLAKSGVTAFLLHRTYRFLAGCQASVASRLARRWFSTDVHRVQSVSDVDIEYSLTQATHSATTGILGPAAIIVTELTLLVVLGLALLFIDPVAALLSAVSFLMVALVIQKVVGARARRLGQTAATSSLSARQSIRVAMDSYRELKTARRMGFPLRAFEVNVAQAAQTQASATYVVNAPRFAYEAALVVSAAALATWQFTQSDVASALAVLAVFLTTAARLLPSMVRLQGQLGLLAHSAGNAGRAFILAGRLGDQGVSISLEDVGVAQPTGGDDYAGFSASIDVVGVLFAYPQAPTPALIDVSLRVEPGSSLVLVGATGSGKSTLVDVMLGFLTPSTGRVSISGVTPGEAERSWPGAIAYMPQMSAMWQLSIRENVALGLPAHAIDDEAVWDALERAFIVEDVRDLGGLDAVIGPAGRSLSGGQRQRLAIARALYSRPRLLVLDEATSALDEETEASIGGVLDEFRGRVTVVAVAHRRATIERADTVVAIDHGRVVFVGKPLEYFAARDLAPTRSELR